MEEDGNKSVLKALFIADTHLLGPIKGHWFDKLRREWQMHRAFLTAMDYFRPEVVFFLGTTCHDNIACLYDLHLEYNCYFCIYNDRGLIRRRRMGQSTLFR